MTVSISTNEYRVSILGYRYRKSDTRIPIPRYRLLNLDTCQYLTDELATITHLCKVSQLKFVQIEDDSSDPSAQSSVPSQISDVLIHK